MMELSEALNMDCEFLNSGYPRPDMSEDERMLWKRVMKYECMILKISKLVGDPQNANVAGSVSAVLFEADGK